jgi:hypothetical protein
MDHIQQPQPTGTGAANAGAAAELAGIHRRQERVIKAVLVPVWYWWVIAAGIVAIGAARDSGDLVVQAVTIPLAVLVMAVLTGVMIPAVRHRVQVNSTTQPGARGVAAISGLIVLVDGVIVGTAIGVATAHDSHPATIGCAAGAAVIVMAGPLVNRYLRRLMLTHGLQEMGGAPQAAGTV